MQLIMFLIGYRNMFVKCLYVGKGCCGRTNLSFFVVIECCISGMAATFYVLSGSYAQGFHFCDIFARNDEAVSRISCLSVLVWIVFGVFRRWAG